MLTAPCAVSLDGPARSGGKQVVFDSETSKLDERVCRIDIDLQEEVEGAERKLEVAQRVEERSVCGVTLSARGMGEFMTAGYRSDGRFPPA
jgi:hypothetical protein